MIVPGGGISLDGTRWVACRPNFLLYVGVLSRLFRRLILEKLAAAHAAGALRFFGKHAALSNAPAFAAYLAPLRNSEWGSIANAHSGDPRKYCAISPATPIASPSPTADWSPPTPIPSPSGGRTTASTARPLEDDDALPA